ncbi:serine/threonine protein kinase, CMGC [Coemansia sp. RSA 552]|nr:serine/threonine protein kinase, CMGC [Coemansia sp. RSA 552]
MLAPLLRRGGRSCRALRPTLAARSRSTAASQAKVDTEALAEISAEVSKLKVAQLSAVMKSCALAQGTTKARKIDALSSFIWESQKLALDRYRSQHKRARKAAASSSIHKAFVPQEVVSIDIGFRNLAFAHVSKSGEVLGWQRSELLAEASFEPWTLAEVVERFVHESLPVRPAQQCTYIIEHQRFRTQGSAAVTNSTMVNSLVEALLYANLRHAGAHIEAINPALVSSHWRIADSWGFEDGDGEDIRPAASRRGSAKSEAIQGTAHAITQMDSVLYDQKRMASSQHDTILELIGEPARRKRAARSPAARDMHELAQKGPRQLGALRDLRRRLIKKECAVSLVQSWILASLAPNAKHPRLPWLSAADGSFSGDLWPFGADRAMGFSPEVCGMFCSEKKKDDLCDCIAQAVAWFRWQHHVVSALDTFGSARIAPLIGSVLNAKRRAMAKKQKHKAVHPASEQKRSAKIEEKAAQSPVQPSVQSFPAAHRREGEERVSASNDGNGSYSNSDDYSDEPDMEEEDIEDYRKGGYHPVKIGDSFKNQRYKVVRKLGWGHFSTVWLAYDHDKDIHVALKIVKSAAHYTEAALDEIELCTRTVSAREPHPGRDHVAKMLDSFEHSGPNGRHVCMVFEVLGENLLSLLRNARRYGSLRGIICAPRPENGPSAAADDKTRSDDGLPVPLVKQIARQIIAGLAFLHGPCNMIHTDLKPENVLVCIDNVEGVIRTELRNDAAAGSGYDQSALVHASRSVANSRAPSPVNGDAADNSEQAELDANPAQSLEKDLNDISIAGTPQYSQCGSASSVPSTSAASSPGQQQGLKVKLADLGNATWADHHFTEDIQTRQYRSPEVIIGSRWDATADIWSCACLIFELLTGDYLFEPHSGARYSKDEDHIAQIIETLGPFPKKFALSGRFSSELFNRRGELRHIRRLNPFPLRELLRDEYGFTAHEAREIAEFLSPMLEINPSRRTTAASMLSHRWLL